MSERADLKKVPVHFLTQNTDLVLTQNCSAFLQLNDNQLNLFHSTSLFIYHVSQINFQFSTLLIHLRKRYTREQITNTIPLVIL